MNFSYRRKSQLREAIFTVLDWKDGEAIVFLWNAGELNYRERALEGGFRCRLSERSLRRRIVGLLGILFYFLLSTLFSSVRIAE